MQKPLTTDSGITKKELLEYLQNRKDIPDESEITLIFNNESRRFVASFYWSEKGVPAVFGEDILEFSKVDSEEAIKDVFKLSL